MTIRIWPQRNLSDAKALPGSPRSCQAVTPAEGTCGSAVHWRVTYRWIRGEQTWETWPAPACARAHCAPPAPRAGLRRCVAASRGACVPRVCRVPPPPPWTHAPRVLRRSPPAGAVEVLPGGWGGDTTGTRWDSPGGRRAGWMPAPRGRLRGGEIRAGRDVGNFSGTELVTGRLVPPGSRPGPAAAGVPPWCVFASVLVSVEALFVCLANRGHVACRERSGVVIYLWGIFNWMRAVPSGTDRGATSGGVFRGATGAGTALPKKVNAGERRVFVRERGTELVCHSSCPGVARSRWQSGRRFPPAEPNNLAGPFGVNNQKKYYFSI